jgi:hypothetical protein
MLIFQRKRPPFVLALIFLAGGLVAATFTSLQAANPEAAFLAENQTAMTRMMAGMNAQPSGDVDRDFIATMIPHHQGAIDMAKAELRYGRNEKLRRISQEIIVEQQQEIAAMRLAVGEALPPSTASPDQPSDVQGSQTILPSPRMNMNMNKDQ